jgi:hypothetical protein
MTTVRHPGAVPELTAEPGARSVVSGVRACAVVMSDAAEVMHKNSAPEGFEGDPAEVSHHAMTNTARDLDAATAALQVGLVAFDAFCDRMDTLRADRTHLITRRHTLEATADALVKRQNASDAASDAGLAGDIEHHNAGVGTFDGDVQAWDEKVATAEDRLIAALRTADTTSEAIDLAGRAPDVPSLIEDMERLGKDPAAINTWWLALSRAEREALKVAHPELIGNLDGIPLADRDESNRAHLSALYNTLKERDEDGELTSDDEKDLMAKAQEIYKALDAAHGQLDENELPLSTFLMVFDPAAAEGDGHAAIAFGNPETADHVSVNVPGLSSTMNNFAGVAGDAARVREMAARQGDGSVASIAWLGYNAPDFDMSLDGIRDGLGVTGEGKAANGARDLSHFIDGLRETRQGDPAHITVIGHSYGSTTVGKAAGLGMDADDVVLVGSPGAGGENPKASDLSGHVYVGSSDEDFVTHLGGADDKSLGADPASEDFGAVRFRVDPQGEFNISGSGVGRGIENHTSYFDDADTMAAEGRGDQDSASLVNIGKVVAGHGDQVERVDERTESNEAWWIKQGADDTLNWFERRVLRR